MSTDATNTALAALIATALEPAVAAAVERAVSTALAARAPKPTARLLDVKAVAERLGVHKETVRRAHRSGKLVAVEALGSLRFQPEIVDAFIAGGEK